MQNLYIDLFLLYSYVSVLYKFVFLVTGDDLPDSASFGKVILVTNFVLLLHVMNIARQLLLS